MRMTKRKITVGAAVLCGLVLASTHLAQQRSPARPPAPATRTTSTAFDPRWYDCRCSGRAREAILYGLPQRHDKIRRHCVIEAGSRPSRAERRAG